MLSRPAPSTSRDGTAIEAAASNPSGNAYRFMRENPELSSRHTYRVVPGRLAHYAKAPVSATR